MPMKEGSEVAARWFDKSNGLGISRPNFDEALAVLEAKRRDPSKPWTVDEMLESLRNNSSELGLVCSRALERVKAGANFHEAWRLALTERLGKARREQWSRQLLQLTADLFLEEHEAKLKSEWERSPERQWEQIAALAKWLKARNIRACRGEAEKIVAGLHGVTVHALRQRRYRLRGSGRRHPKA
jgi:hypothetical protein